MAATKTAKARPAKGRVINLDKLLAARREARGEPIVVEFAGRKWTLPPELPARVVTASNDSDGGIAATVQALLGDQTDEFYNQGLSIEDLGVFIEAVFEAYGLSEGESEASQDS